MNNNVIQINTDFKHLETLDEILLELSKYGTFALYYHDDKTYSVKLNLFVIGQGISFSIGSDYKQVSALNAAQQCYERLILAMKDISQKLPKEIKK